ncbi:MAG: diaminopimelate epimerase [Bacteroidota bacterium]
MGALSFWKYQGTGNDFVMIDNREGRFDPQDTDRVAALCDRRFGIGADGLILIQNHPDHDFEMVYFNADGSQSLCGNGSRCAMMFAQQLGIIEDRASFLAYDGPHEAYIKEGRVYLLMHDVNPVQVVGQDAFADTGSPHHLVWVEDADVAPVVAQGRSIRESETYAPGGTNVNFVEVDPDAGIRVRTYERGVEDETLSCGTGVTAAALAASEKGLPSPIRVETRGGQLEVSFTKRDDNGFTDVYLIGPAKAVFQGTVS